MIITRVNMRLRRNVQPLPNWRRPCASSKTLLLMAAAGLLMACAVPAPPLRAPSIGPDTRLNTRIDPTTRSFRCPISAYTSQPSPTNLTTTWFTNGLLWAGPDRAYGGKWFAGGMKIGWWRIVPGTLTVSGRRLDQRSDAPVVADISDGYGKRDFQSSGIDIPTAGCWEIVGRVGDAELRFVVDVLPKSQNPTPEMMAR